MGTTILDCKLFKSEHCFLFPPSVTLAQLLSHNCFVVSLLTTDCQGVLFSFWNQVACSVDGFHLFYGRDSEQLCGLFLHLFSKHFSTCFSTSVVQEPHAIASPGCLIEIPIPGAQFRTTKSDSRGLGPGNKPVKCWR